MRKNAEKASEQFLKDVADASDQTARTPFNTNGKYVDIVIELQLQKEPVLAARISLPSTQKILERSALDVLLQKMQDHKISVIWDRAYFPLGDITVLRETLQDRENTPNLASIAAMAKVESATMEYLVHQKKFGWLPFLPAFKPKGMEF